MSNGNSGSSPAANTFGNSAPLSAVRPDEDVILALGTEALCDDLELKPDDFRILIFAWKCNAEQVNMAMAMNTELSKGYNQPIKAYFGVANILFFL